MENKKELDADALCRLDTGCTPRGDNEQDLEPPEALIPQGEGLGEDVTPFLPRFLLQEIIFAHSSHEGVYPNQPSGESSVQSGLALSTRTSRLHPGAARANIPAQGSAPRRGGPCWPRCLSTDSPGSWIMCLGIGAQAGQTAPVLGEQTVSTTQNQTSGSGTWMEIIPSSDWKALSRRTALCQTKRQKIIHRLDTFPGICTIVTSASQSNKLLTSQYRVVV